MIKVEVLLKNGNKVKGNLVAIKNGTILLGMAQEWNSKKDCFRGTYEDFYCLGLTEGQYKECKFIDE